MMPLKLNHVCTVKEVNGRSDRGNEELPLIATLSLSACMKIDDLEVLFGADNFDMKSFKKAMYTSKGDRITQSNHKWPMDYACQGLRMEVLVDAATKKAKQKSIFISNEAKVMGFKIEFTIGFQVIVEFAAAAIVSEAQHKKGQMDIFYSYLHKPITLLIDPIPSPQGDMLEDLPK